MTITCVVSRLHDGALLMAVKQCKLIAPLCKLLRAAEQALSIAAVHQMTLRLDSVIHNNNRTSNDDDNKNKPKFTQTIKHNNTYNNEHKVIWHSLLVR